jgi:hypothetical protein
MTAEQSIASHLQAHIERRGPPAGVSYVEAYRAAVLADWKIARPEEVQDDGNGCGVIRSSDGFIGCVGTTSGSEKPLHDFRSSRKSARSRQRIVFAVDEEGVVWVVGYMRKPRSTEALAKREAARLDRRDTRSFGGSLPSWDGRRRRW